LLVEVVIRGTTLVAIVVRIVEVLLGLGSNGECPTLEVSVCQVLSTLLS
jgi:hypothetical protein